MEAHPTYVSARVVLGRSYMESGDHAKAEEEFHRIVESSPDNLRARVHLGEICAAQGRADEAIRHFQAALELAPLDREIRASLMKVGGAVSHFGPPLSTQQTQGMAGPSRAVPVAERIGVQEDLPATETLADLYVSQGLTERGAAIYRQLLDEEPSRKGIQTKLLNVQKPRQDAEGPPLMSPDATVAPPTWKTSQPGFVTESLPLFDLCEGAGAVAVPPSFAVSHQRMRLHELERWLQAVRRYRRTESGQ